MGEFVTRGAPPNSEIAHRIRMALCEAGWPDVRVWYDEDHGVFVDQEAGVPVEVIEKAFLVAEPGRDPDLHEEDLTPGAVEVKGTR